MRRQGGRCGRHGGADVSERAQETGRLRSLFAAAVRQMSGARAAARPETRGRRSARVLAFAKINLDLRVLYRRPDGFHELRTIFQTISLADRIQIAYTPSPKTDIRVSGNAEIPDNLIARAARLCLDTMHSTGTVELELDKKIPMGAGLGGGSSDAAAVLLALPVVAGKWLEMPELM